MSVVKTVSQAFDDSPFLKLDGTRTMTAKLQMGSNQIEGLAAGTGSGDAVEVDQAVATFMPFSGGTFTGNTTHIDNILSRYGTAGDATIGYNGTNLIIESDVVGTGKTVFRTHVIMQDNVEHWYGNSGDGRLSYNGTDVFMDPDAVGGGKFRVGGDIRADGIYYKGATAGTTSSLSWVNNEGDTVTLTFLGGMCSVATAAAP